MFRRSRQACRRNQIMSFQKVANITQKIRDLDVHHMIHIHTPM